MADPRSPRACVVNLGCRVNRVESDWMESALVDAGCLLVGQEEAELVIVNSCGVTGEAQAKTRKAVRHAATLPSRPLVAVTGCVASLFPEDLSGLGNNVLVLPAKLAAVGDALSALRARREVVGTGSVLSESDSHAWSGPGLYPSPSDDNVNTDDEGRTQSLSAAALGPERRLKRGVKVQDGCDNQCAYCIVWKARGKSRSVPLDDIERQVTQVLDEGAAEIDLTGVNLGRFRGSDGSGHEVGLAGLIDRVASLVRGRGIVRASSLEPQDVDESVLEAMAGNADVVCPHLHLPLQSGCNATLTRMGRPYDRAAFARLAARARELMPGFALTTDVIVGFPGETEDEFNQSYDFCQDMAFSKLHVFRYSARPGTPAATMPDQVAPEAMRERSLRLRELSLRMGAADARARVGSHTLALVEREEGEGGLGTSASFHRVRVTSADAGPVSCGLAKVLVTGAEPDGSLVCRLESYVRLVQRTDRDSAPSQDAKIS